MPDKEQFGKAIESIGDEVFLITEGREEIAFRACIQPVISGRGGAASDFSRIGRGERKIYKLYAPRNAITAGIKEGGSIMHCGCIYLVEKIEDMRLYGEVYFREGVLRKRSPGGSGDGG